MSQISTRLITFFLNLLTARLLTIDAYGVSFHLPCAHKRLFSAHFCRWTWCIGNMANRVKSVQLASIQFHLINTFILFLSREGFRRGCLRAQQSSASPSHISRNVLTVAALTLPLGALTSLCTCGVALRGNPSWTNAYAYAIYLQGEPDLCKQVLYDKAFYLAGDSGDDRPNNLQAWLTHSVALRCLWLRIGSQLTDVFLLLILCSHEVGFCIGMAAMVELMSEPLYILAQLHLKLQLRVFAEAAATLARGIATLTLLKSSSLDVGIALSVAQVWPCLPCTQPLSCIDRAMPRFIVHGCV